MSTKDLSRSVMEGGRRRWNAWTRRRSHRVVRAEERAVERRILLGSTAADVEDAEAWPRVSRVPREFADRLSAPERWLESKVGRSWNQVRSEMLARFDTRTLAGRHIVFDHLSPKQQGARSQASGRWIACASVWTRAGSCDARPRGSCRVFRFAPIPS